MNMLILMCLLPVIASAMDHDVEQGDSEPRTSIRQNAEYNIRPHRAARSPSVEKLIHEAIQETYKEKKLDHVRDVEQIQANQKKFTAIISAATGIISAILATTVTIMLKSGGDCPGMGMPGNQTST